MEKRELETQKTVTIIYVYQGKYRLEKKTLLPNTTQYSVDCQWDFEEIGVALNFYKMAKEEYGLTELVDHI